MGVGGAVPLVVLAIPRELPRSQYADLIRDYCREFFVSKGMIADFAIHDKGDGNPHAHIPVSYTHLHNHAFRVGKSGLCCFRFLEFHLLCIQKGMAAAF